MHLILLVSCLLLYGSNCRLIISRNVSLKMLSKNVVNNDGLDILFTISMILFFIEFITHLRITLIQMFLYGFHGNIYIYILCSKYNLDACKSDHDNLRLTITLKKGLIFLLKCCVRFMTIGLIDLYL